jgi:hypothetical protein
MDKQSKRQNIDDTIHPQKEPSQLNSAKIGVYGEQIP